MGEGLICRLGTCLLTDRESLVNERDFLLRHFIRFATMDLEAG